MGRRRRFAFDLVACVTVGIENREGAMAGEHDCGGAIALITAIFVEALEETDPEFRARFIRKMDDAYSRVRHDASRISERDLEVVSWCRQAVSGWSPVDGQEEPLLKR